MKLNRPLKDTRDKELSNLRFEMLFYSAGAILVPVISEPYYKALIELGYPNWLIIISLVIYCLLFIIEAIITHVKISQTKKLCKEFQKNIDAYSPSGQNIKSPAERIFRILQIFVLSITRKWRAERRKAELDSKVSEMLCSQVPELLQKNDSLAEENSRYREQLIESSNAQLDKNRMDLQVARTDHPKRNVENLFLIEDEEKKRRLIEKFSSILERDKNFKEGYANNIAIFYWAALRLRYISDNVDAFSSMFHEKSGKTQDAFRKALSRAKTRQANSNSFESALKIESALKELENL